MAKNGKKKGGREDMVGPLYTKPDGYELGPHRVEGPRGGMSPSDPLGIGHGKLRGGPGGQQRKQSHDKD
jgi:hypothetical protein